MSDSENDNISRQEKINALLDVARFDPKFTVLIVGLGLVAAVLEGVGLSFILPIIEIVQADDPVAEADGLMAVFVTAYQTLGIPFTLGFVVVGVSAVMTLRYTTSFVVAWFREALRTYYIRDLQLRAFRNALDANVEYFDKEGSDNMLNAIVTQTYYAGRVNQRVAKFMETLFLALAYLLITLVIAPLLTLFAIVVLGGLMVLLRYMLELEDIDTDANGLYIIGRVRTNILWLNIAGLVVALTNGRLGIVNQAVVFSKSNDILV